MLELENVYAGYGDFEALHGISLSVREGEIVALLGGNAAGKTTAIQCICGLVTPTAGSIRWQGRDITRIPPEERTRAGIVQVPEGRRLFGTMTVRENLELGAYTPRARKRLKENLAYVTDLFPLLGERQHALAGSLSGGQQQMVAIARGLMAEPVCLMLDEPSLGLAPLVVEEIMAAVREINRRGVTVLIVEQNARKSLELAHRAYVLESGEVVLEGASADLMANDELRRAYLGL